MSAFKASGVLSTDKTPPLRSLLIMLEELLINKIEQIISVGNLLESCAVADKERRKRKRRRKSMGVE